MRWSGLRRLGVAGVVALAVCAAPGTASARTFFPDCSYTPVFKPKTIQVGCVAVLRQLKNLKWYRWKPNRARARGKLQYASCEPTCVDGGVRTRRARVVLFRKRRCSYSHKRVFTRMTVFERGQPKARYELRCRP